MMRWSWASAIALVAAIAGIPSSAQAQTDPYPSKPVRIIVDSAPGSATDVASRLMADRLTQLWGQQVIVDNRPGAGGSIAARAASQAAPDGYTLYVGAASVFTAVKGAPGVAPNFPIELPRDFAPIGFMTQQPMYIAVAPSLGVNSLPELIALAKQKPGELSYATTGRGRITHLTMELLQSRAGIKLQMIPYSGGPHAAMSDLATGRVQIVVEGYSGLAGAVTGGSIKGIAVAAHERLPGHDYLPTVAETLPGFLAGGWNVLLAPVGTPDAIIRKANADLRKALDDPELRTRLATMGSYLRSMTPAEVTAFSQEQQRIWQPVAEHVAKQAAEQSR
jgi:tripartite-type tricarboxylate transporter receptor subunit TctC